jgi:hypothetical protein
MKRKKPTGARPELADKPQDSENEKETGARGDMGRFIVGKAMPDEPELEQPPDAGHNSQSNQRKNVDTWLCGDVGFRGCTVS